MNLSQYLEELGFFKGIKYYLVDLYSMLKERAGRAYSYAKFGWGNPDFDYAYLWELVEFKLKRMLDCLENGIAVHEKEDLEALKEAIKLANRFAHHDYEEKHYNKLNKVWGKPRHTKVYKNGMRVFKAERSKVKTEADQKNFSKGLKQVYKLAEKDRAADVARFCKIVQKYSLHWWE